MMPNPSSPITPPVESERERGGGGEDGVLEDGDSGVIG